MRAIENARAHVSSLIGSKQHEIIFTSGGTEADGPHDQLGLSRCRSSNSAENLRRDRGPRRRHRSVNSADRQRPLP